MDMHIRPLMKPNFSHDRYAEKVTCLDTLDVLIKESEIVRNQRGRLFHLAGDYNRSYLVTFDEHGYAVGLVVGRKLHSPTYMSRADMGAFLNTHTLMTWPVTTVPQA